MTSNSKTFRNITSCKRIISIQGISSPFLYFSNFLFLFRLQPSSKDDITLTLSITRIQSARPSSSRRRRQKPRRHCSSAIAVRRDDLATCVGSQASRAGRWRGPVAGANAVHEGGGHLAWCDGVFAAAGQHLLLAGADCRLDDEIELALSLLPSMPPTLPVRP